MSPMSEKLVIKSTKSNESSPRKDSKVNWDLFEKTLVKTSLEYMNTEKVNSCYYTMNTMISEIVNQLSLVPKKDWYTTVSKTSNSVRLKRQVGDCVTNAVNTRTQLEDFLKDGKVKDLIFTVEKSNGRNYYKLEKK